MLDSTSGVLKYSCFTSSSEDVDLFSWRFLLEGTLGPPRLLFSYLQSLCFSVHYKLLVIFIVGEHAYNLQGTVADCQLIKALTELVRGLHYSYEQMFDTHIDARLLSITPNSRATTVGGLGLALTGTFSGSF